jgi:polysaccharide biosynthesis transport protein
MLAARTPMAEPNLRTSPAPTTLAEDAASGALRLWKTLRKHWAIILSTLILSVGVAVTYNRTAEVAYQATALVEFDPNPIRPLGEKGANLSPNYSSYWDHREFFETQYKLLVSDEIMRRVIQTLGLMSDPDFLPKKPAKEGARPFGVDDLAAVLRKRVTVEPVKNSRLVYVKFEDKDPKRARLLCETLVKVYLQKNLDGSVGQTSEALTWLNGQVDALRHELESTENKLHDFKEKNSLPSLSINEASNMLRVELQELSEALTKTRTRRQELKARQAELEKVPSDKPDSLPATELLQSAYLQQVRKGYLDAVAERAQLLAENKGENHPLVRKAQERVDEQRKALLAEVENIKGAVTRDLAVVEREESGKAKLYEEARQRAVDLNMKAIEYHRLDRDRENNEKLFSLLLERTKEADLQRMLRVNNARLADPPVEPRAPVRPRTFVNLALGIVFGLLFGAGFAYLREQLDVSLKTPDDVENKLSVSFLGLLPELGAGSESGGYYSYYRRRSKEKKEAGKRRRALTTEDRELPPELVVHERPLSGIAEAARAIRTNVLFMNPDNPYRRILVTSSVPGEGKTTVACSIAIAMAQSGQRVVMIDCDLRRPRLHRIYDRVGDAGVTNVLIGQSTVDEVAKPSIVPNLWTIPAGPIPPNPADILHSEAFKRFIEELSQKFDRVVIDSPPLVAVTDAAIISTIIDGTIFVTRAFKTSRALARQGLKTLWDVDSRIIGAVLNAVDLRKHEYSYYKQYYYYRKEGYAPLTPPESGAPGTDTHARDDARDDASSPPPN